MKYKVNSTFILFWFQTCFSSNDLLGFWNKIFLSVDLFETIKIIWSEIYFAKNWSWNKWETNLKYLQEVWKTCNFRTNFPFAFSFIDIKVWNQYNTNFSIVDILQLSYDQEISVDIYIKLTFSNLWYNFRPLFIWLVLVETYSQLSTLSTW